MYHIVTFLEISQQNTIAIRNGVGRADWIIKAMPISHLQFLSSVVVLSLPFINHQFSLFLFYLWFWYSFECLFVNWYYKIFNSLHTVLLHTYLVRNICKICDFLKRLMYIHMILQRVAPPLSMRPHVVETICGSYSDHCICELLNGPNQLLNGALHFTVNNFEWKIWKWALLPAKKCLRNEKLFLEDDWLLFLQKFQYSWTPHHPLKIFVFQIFTLHLPNGYF